MSDINGTKGLPNAPDLPYNYMARLKLCCTSNQATPITIDHIPLEIDPVASDGQRVGGSVSRKSLSIIKDE